MKQEIGHRQPAFLSEPRVPSEHDLDEITTRTNDMTIYSTLDRSKSVGKETSENSSQEKSTTDLIQLLESLKIGPKKERHGLVSQCGNGIKNRKEEQRKNKFDKVLSENEKNEYLQRGSGNRHMQDNSHQHTAPNQDFGHLGTKLEPAWSPQSQQDSRVRFTQQRIFAPSLNQSCRVWTEFHKKNQLDKLFSFERRIINEGRDVIDGVGGNDFYEMEDNLGGTDDLEMDVPFAPIAPPVSEKVFDFLLNEDEQNWNKNICSPQPNWLQESHNEPDLILKYPEQIQPTLWDNLFKPKPQSNSQAKSLQNSNSQSFTKPFDIGESKPSPPKQANIDAMYDKDIDEDNILHSMIIANASESLMNEVLNNLKHDGEDVLKKLINDQNHLLRTPLFLAVMDQKLEIVKLLLEFGADPNIQGKVLITMDQYELRAPLHLLAEMGDHTIQILEELVDCEKTDLDIRSLSDRLVPLHVALMSHKVKQEKRAPKSCKLCIQELINAGANTDVEDDRSSKTPIMLAIDTLDLQVVKIFLNPDYAQKQDDIRLKLQAATRGGDTALHIAAGVRLERNIKMQLLRLLIRHGADTNTENNVKELPEVIASRELWRAAFKC